MQGRMLPHNGGPQPAQPHAQEDLQGLPRRAATSTAYVSVAGMTPESKTAVADMSDAASLRRQKLDALKARRVRPSPRAESEPQPDSSIASDLVTMVGYAEDVAEGNSVWLRSASPSPTKSPYYGGTTAAAGQAACSRAAGWSSSSMQAPEDLKLFWNALLATDFPVGSFLSLPSNVYLLGKKWWGSALLVRHCYRGTPGIGKSFFAVVLMAWLVREKNVSTIVYDTASIRYLFTFSNGTSVDVEMGRRKDFTEKLMNSATWWIIDMGTALERGANTVLLASPDKARYKEFLKLQGANPLYMPIWTNDEIEKCRSRLFPTLDAAMVEALKSKWGNIPRYVLERALNEWAQGSLDMAITVCRWKDIMRCIGEPDSAVHASHKLVHLDVVDDHYHKITMKMASPYVMRAMEEKGGKAHVQRLQDLVRMSMGDSAYASAAGSFFERYAHRRLQKGGSFKVRRLCSSRIKKPQATELKLQPSPEIHEFNNVTEVQHQGIGVYCIPRIHTFPAVDAIIQPDILLQMTATRKRRINLGGLIAAARQLIGPKQRLYFTVPNCIFAS
ncbi:hypothetical protein Vretimale_13969 [Volvox reticuliferus]|uniref:Uncharacterized protein n=1 Tax=Volvox reticuliferus TaxID=1737510 RepID=A0A8J4CYN6_9CHLO|nr:hypothetical protein Vretifemale_16140 [Volvox reticuliferus]GIM10221.1 hypothetical protein Vretimale_13969 [Volvox reticuliferus]